MSKEKSVLDGMKIINKAFPTQPNYEGPETSVMVVVGKCPQCECPIYGKSAVKENEKAVVKRTCSCMEVVPKSIHDLNIPKEQGLEKLGK